MYSDVKSRIVHANSASDIFTCEIGVRQGENLSPLENVNADGLKSINTDIENELSVYLKLFLLLYADDTFLLAESRED